MATTESTPATDVAPSVPVSAVPTPEGATTDIPQVPVTEVSDASPTQTTESVDPASTTTTTSTTTAPAPTTTSSDSTYSANNTSSPTNIDIMPAVGMMPPSGMGSASSTPTSVGPAAAPPHSASLYVGDLHPDIAESQLYEIFQALGPVQSIRVCRDVVTRRSLGYAYLNFHNTADAERALETMNYYSSPLTKNKPLRMMWMIRDPSQRRTGAGNIFVKSLEKSIDNKSLYDTFSQFGNILSCKVATDDKGNSLGHGFVHFETPEAAQAAIDQVNGKLLEGRKVYVGKFLNKREREAAGHVSKIFTNVYVKNVDESLCDEDKLRDVFIEFGDITSIHVAIDDDGKPRGFAFINYASPEMAKRAVDEMNNKELGGKPITVCPAQKKSVREAELRSKFEMMRNERMQKYQGINLYIKNLSDDIDDERLRTEFSPFGTITSCKIMRDEKNFSRGFGFVCFTQPEEATKAVTELNGRMIGQKPIYVALAQRKDVRRAQLEAQRAMNIRMPHGGMPPGAAAAMYTQPPSPYVYQPPMPNMGQVPGGPMGAAAAARGAGGYMNAQYVAALGRGGNNAAAVAAAGRGGPVSAAAAAAAATGGIVPPYMMGRGQPPMGGAPGQMGPGGMGGFGVMGQPRQPRQNRRGGNPMQPGGAPGPMSQGRGNGAPNGANPNGANGPAGRGRGGMNPQGNHHGAPPPQAYNKFGPRNPNAPPQGQQGAAVMQAPPQPNGQAPTTAGAGSAQEAAGKAAGMPSVAEPLTIEMLTNANPQQQKQMLGERLYPLITGMQPRLGGKITGMLLDMENTEILHLLESPEALSERVDEAVGVLREHAAGDAPQANGQS